MKKHGLQAMIAAHQEFVRRMLGPGKRERRYPTMEEYYDEDREREAMREYREWMLKLKAQNSLINGAPIVIGTQSKNALTTVTSSGLPALDVLDCVAQPELLPPNDAEISA